MDTIQALAARVRQFGSKVAAQKLRLLERVAGRQGNRSRRARLLRDSLEFMRAYPDNVRVQAALKRVAEQLPARVRHSHAYSYAVARSLLEIDPKCLEIDWDADTDEVALGDLLAMLVLPGEAQGVEDISIPYRSWFSRARRAGTGMQTGSDLAFLLDLVASSGLPPQWQSYVYDRLGLPLAYSGPPSTRLAMEVDHIHYQRNPIDREWAPIDQAIRTPLRRRRRGPHSLMQLALRTLCARKLEIYPLSHGNPDDIHLVECDRGVAIALIGVLSEFRNPLETLAFCLVMKNGLPIAYGPAGVLLGCCEIGINLFPEFRGGEIRFIYSQFMRALHHVLGVRYFFLTAYGMGVDNEEAIASGAFWFYRKLGFRPTNPDVESLALAEERKMAARPGHRSDRRTLRRLAQTEAFLDLSGGQYQPFDLGGLGIAQSQFLARQFRGDRAHAEAVCTEQMQRLLRMPGQTASLRAMAPVLAMIPDLEQWSSGERRALAAIVQAKGAASEFGADSLIVDHKKLVTALQALARSACSRSPD